MQNEADVLLVSFLHSSVSSFDFLCTETSDDRESMISEEFRGNPKNPRKTPPTHASAAPPRNASREPALPNPAGLAARPPGKKLLGPSSHFSNFWRGGFEFPRILGIPRKSSENHHSSENKIRAPDTNRRRGRLRMIGGMVFEPAVAAVRRVGVVGQAD